MALHHFIFDITKSYKTEPNVPLKITSIPLISTKNMLISKIKDVIAFRLIGLPNCSASYDLS